MSEVKVDLKKKLKMYYNPKPIPEIIEIPIMQFLMFDGKKQKHHEIYLSDFRKVDPKKMKTILRQPFSNKM